MRSKKAIYSIFTSLICQVVILLYGFIVPKIIITNYGSNVNGLISSVTQFLAYITLLESGFAPVVKALLYKPIANKNKEEIENILKTAQKFFRNIGKIFILYIILLSIFYPLLTSNSFSYLYTILLILIISLSTFAEYFFGLTYRIYLQSEQKVYIISIIQIVSYLLSIASIVICVKLNASIHVIKLVSGIMFGLRPILQNIYVRKKYNINLKNADENYKIKNKWDGLAQHIASVIHDNTDVFVLTIFTNFIEVSVYSVYYMIVKGIKKVVYIFTSGIEESFGDMIAKKEHDILKNKFGMYETIFFTLSTIIFSASIVLIVPFVSVYTKNITDANYVRILFGCLIVISEYICVIRNPYISLTYAAGHFKETRVGAWIECTTNIIVSIVLVIKYQLIGVAIGTIVAMTIRTIEFIYHSNKYILNRNILISVKKILLLIIETLLIVFISKYLPYVDYNNYLNWIVNAVMVSLLSMIIVISINYIFYKNEFKNLFTTLKSIIRRK